jgi:flagellar M-ring protein FliF
VVRERETTREGEAPLNAKGASGEKAAASGGSNQSESEYAVGHRVEQVISQPGSIRRIQVAVVVHRPLNPEQREQLRDMVAASVGASSDRGDSVVLQVMDGLSGSEVSAKPTDAPGREAGKEPTSPKFDALPARAEGSGSTWLPMISKPVWVPLLAAGTVLGVLLFWGTSAPRGNARRPAEMSEGERQAALAKVEAWMREPASSSHAQGNTGIPYGANTPVDPTR